MQAQGGKRRGNGEGGGGAERGGEDSRILADKNYILRPTSFYIYSRTSPRSIVALSVKI